MKKYISVSNYNNSKDFHKRYKIDNGIPKVDYRFLDNNIGWQYNPVTISQYSLCLYDEFIESNNIRKKEQFFLQVKWLENNIEEFNETCLSLPYNFPNKWYSVSPPWYSGMAQGQAASVFLRAYKLTNDNKYVELSRKLINFMLLGKKDGGTLIYTPEGEPWIEEYVSPRPSMVLNGHLYGLIGLCEFCKVSQEVYYISKMKELINSTIKLIPLYEVDNWLIYARDYNINKCTKKYMGLQVFEAQQLFNLTGRTEFNEIYNRWNQYADWPGFWRDVKKQNKKLFYLIKNLKGYIKKIIKYKQ